MNRRLGNFSSLVGLFLLGLWLTSCSGVSSVQKTVTATSPPPAIASATAPPTTVYTPTAPVETVATLETLQPQSTQPTTPVIESTPASLALKGPTISYNGIHFNVDPVLGDTLYAYTDSMDAVNFARFTFAPDGWCREVGCVEVYPVEAYQAAFPDWPLPPLGAATLLRAQIQDLKFQNGDGTRSVMMRGQAGFFANNEALVYDFQGFTDDGQYYVSIIVPIDAPILLSAFDPEDNTNAEAIPVPELPDDVGQLDVVMREYNQEAKGRLDMLATADFAPSLSALDALVTSLQIETTPIVKQQPPVTPQATSVFTGSFRLVSSIAPALLGEVTGLRATSEGELWVMTTYGYMLLRDGNWTMQPSGRAQILVGVDDAERLWFFLEDDGSQIYFGDGGPEFTAADAGWIPVSDPAAMEGRGVLTDSSGQVWLATERDVRVFDGTRWTVFTPEDMGMTALVEQDILTWFTIELVGDSDQVWVGECQWGGPGPVGGGGARWFDGEAWRGAESPADSGCVTAIREDSLGNVWVGVDSDLWRYNLASSQWERFSAPQPPEGYRFSFITDITIDPVGDPWLLFPLCGGASCVIADVRYRLHEGVWIQIGEPTEEPQTLVFDGAGTPWLLLGGQVYRIQNDSLAEPLAVELRVDAMTVDAAGWVWGAGAQPGGETALWILESEAGAADVLAVCPSPDAEQPPRLEVVEGTSIADMFERQILAYLNARGNAEGLQGALSQLSLDGQIGPDWQAKTQVFTTDVTGDNTPEVVMDLSFFVEGQYADGALFVFRCQAGQYVGGTVAPIGGQVLSGSDPDPGIRTIQDLNANGRPEIVLSQIVVIGTHANFTREFRIIGWDGSQFVDLIRSDGGRPYAAEVLNGDGIVYDTNGDGILELILTHGAGRSLETSVLDRGRTDVWEWDGEAFTLAHSQEAPPMFRIHAVWDGDTATLRGDLVGALTFYQRAIFDEDLLGWSTDYIPAGTVPSASPGVAYDPDERLRLSAYSRYRIMLLHIAGGQLSEAQVVYAILQEKFPRRTAGHAYAELATIFWNGYQSSEDIAAACARSVDYAALHADEVLNPLGSNFYGFGQRDYVPEDICPLQLLSPLSPTLSIEAFSVEVEDITSGKQLTFQWETTGATRAQIWSGTTPRRPKMWDVSPRGVLTVVLEDTYVRDPLMWLVAYDDQNHQVSQSLKTDWSCSYEYFFTPAPEACPLYEAIPTAAAQQSFEHGRMVWMERIHDEEDVILVIYDNGQLARFDDEWVPGEPESDLALVPPDALYQPVRGFGKVWRENMDVQERLGWAFAPEQGFEGVWQEQLRESIPRIAFMRTLDNKIIKTWGWSAGQPSWQSGWSEFPQ